MRPVKEPKKKVLKLKEMEKRASWERKVWKAPLERSCRLLAELLEETGFARVLELDEALRRQVREVDLPVGH